MATIRLGTAVAVRSFQNLSAALVNPEAKFTNLINGEALEDEIGRFRVWSGNLGALQKGHSSLDYRLRDSPLLSSNALKLLQELEENIAEAIAIVSGTRLPYEQQQEKLSGDEDDLDDGFYSEDEDDEEDEGTPKTELEQRFREIVDIIDNLYKLSVRIRQPTLRTRSLKAASYRPKDPETGVDLLEQYAAFDLQHTRELVKHLRAEHGEDADVDHDALIERLSRAITLRRRQFKYWRRHRDKLGISTLLEEAPLNQDPVPRPEVQRMETFDTLEAQPSIPFVAVFNNSPSEKTGGKTLLSVTEATHYHQSLDDIVDSKSVTSYATTVRDLTGKGIELPPPPRTADGERDFECPYCFIICPGRYGKGRPWRTHLLQDLQPYVCTYTECEAAEQLFRSRREWSEHEATHRKAWRCPEHPHAVFRSKSGLEDHLRAEHSDDIAEQQLDSVVKVGETSTVDVREKCPICLISADMEGIGALQNHIANHLERLAAFSLPATTNDESDGGSSVASRGGIASTGSDLSQDLSQISFESDADGNEDESVEDDVVSDELTKTEQEALPQEQEKLPHQSQEPLSADALRNLPDSRHNRMDTYLSNSIEEDDEKALAEAEEHIAEVEAFRTYLLSFQGALNVRFYRRFTWWRGQVIFADVNYARRALKEFDQSRFPDVKIKQTEGQAKLKFSVQATEKFVPNPDRQLSREHDDASVSSGTLSYGSRTDDEGKSPILKIEDIPTLRTLYRSKRLSLRDQSYAPNDAHNQVISFIRHDITRLKVDCIMNSANRSMKITRVNDSLNHYIHKAAGRNLKRECKTLGRVKDGAVRITAGHDLPAGYIIHAARPQYSASSKGMGKFNILAECYRSTLKTAMNHDIRTIAFPCLAAGGCGWPPRVAARIALQEVREFLDVHKAHKFQRIIFCVFSDLDETAYTEFLPVFFPPTHGDLENTVEVEEPEKEIQSIDGTQISALLKDLYIRVGMIAQDLVEFSENMFDFPSAALDELSAISACLGSLRTAFEKPNAPVPRLTPQYVNDFDLIAWVLQSVSAGITEIVEQTKYTRNFGEPSHKTIWDDYSFHLANSTGLNTVEILELCNKFVSSLRNVLAIGAAEPDNMEVLRTKLDAWKKKRIGGKSEREHFDEIMYSREFTSPAPLRAEDEPPPRQTGNVDLSMVPSLARLYQIGKLEHRATNAIPDRRQLRTVCLLREDITRLEVDAITNSTDPNFLGMGTLDRSIFRKGGLSMAQDCGRFGECKEGDIKVTPGYLLPVQHVLHAIPPETMRHNTKDLLRKIYRDVLFTATNLKCKSLAIPTIGTGMLNYPRRECASLAMEEVKRFIETMDSNSTLEKIIFCVYGSNDEFIYKSLLPVYFPPMDLGNKDKALPQGSSSAQQDLESSTSSLSSDTSPPKRTLFRSIGDALRGVRFAKPPAVETPRALTTGEEDALINFETHARSCPTCSNIMKAYNEGRNLCPEGYAAAQLVLQYLYMESTKIVYSTHLQGGKRVTVEIPVEYSACWNLLVTVEGSYRDSTRSRPFVTPNQPWPGDGGDQKEEEAPTNATIHGSEATVPVREDRRGIVVKVLKWSDRWDDWEPLYQSCQIQISPSGIDFFQLKGDVSSRISALLIGFNTLLDVTKRATDVQIKTQKDRYLLRTQNVVDCDLLYQRIQRARPPSESLTVHFEDPTIGKTEAQRATALIFAWSEENKQLLPLHPEECNIYIQPGRIYVYEMDERARSQVPLLSLETTPLTSLIKSGRCDVAIKARTLSDSRLKSENEIVFRSHDDAKCEELFQLLKHVARRNPQYEAHQSIRGSADEPSTTATPSKTQFKDVHNAVVRIFGRPQLSSDWRMMFPSQCFAVVEPGKLTVHEMTINRSAVRPLLSLRLPRSRAIHIMKNNETEIMIVPTPEVWEQSRIQLEGDFTLACRNKTETEEFFTALKSALVDEQPKESSQQRTDKPEEAISNLPSQPTHNPSISSRPTSLLTQKIQALQSRSESLSSPPLPLSNLPEMSVSRDFLNQSQQLLELSKTFMQLGSSLHIEVAASRLNITREKALRLTEYLRDVGLARMTHESLIYALEEPPYAREIRAQSRFLREAEEGQLENVTLLAKRVLALLKSLPTNTFNSYDLHQQDIARWLGVEGADVVRALNDLRNLKLVEKTLDEQTWAAVGNDEPSVNASLVEQRPRSPKKGLLSVSQQPEGRGPSPGPGSKLDLSIAGLSKVNIDDFFTYLDLALGTDQLATGPPGEPAEPRPLKRSTTLDSFDRFSKPRDSHVHASRAPPDWDISDDETVPKPTSADPEEDIAMVSHPRPISPNHDQPKPIPPGARWTKIDRRLVNAQALEEANERFEQREESNIVLRVLSRDEIMKLAERTREIRRSREEMIEFARKVGDDAEYEGKEKDVVQ